MYMYTLNIKYYKYSQTSPLWPISKQMKVPIVERWSLWERDII